MIEQPCIYVLETDYVVHVCKHQHVDIPLNDRTEDGDPCGFCPQCGIRFVHRSVEALAAMRRKDILRARIRVTFPF